VSDSEDVKILRAMAANVREYTGLDARAAALTRAADALALVPKIRAYVELMESAPVQGSLAFAAQRGVGRCSLEQAQRADAIRDEMKAALAALEAA
jgi:hypothetical protein